MRSTPDQAIELFLKERVRAGGKSIYKNPKETISVYRAYEILADDLKVAIPEKPDLELLHEERNSIQHKYLNPSSDDAAFHIHKAMGGVSTIVSILRGFRGSGKRKEGRARTHL